MEERKINLPGFINYDPNLSVSSGTQILAKMMQMQEKVAELVESKKFVLLYISKHPSEEKDMINTIATKGLRLDQPIQMDMWLRKLIDTWKQKLEEGRGDLEANGKG